MSKNYLRPTNYQWTPCVIMPAGRASYINRYGNEVIDYFDPITGIILQRVIVVPIYVQPPLPLPVVDVLTNADSRHAASSPTVIGETAHIPTGVEQDVDQQIADATTIPDTVAMHSDHTSVPHDYSDLDTLANRMVDFLYKEDDTVSPTGVSTNSGEE